MTNFFCDVCGWAGADCVCTGEDANARREKHRADFVKAAEHLAGLFELGEIEVRKVTAAAETALGHFLRLADELRELPDLGEEPRPERADPPIEGETAP